MKYGRDRGRGLAPPSAIPAAHGLFRQALLAPSTAVSTAVWTAARTSRSQRENSAQARGRSVDAVRRVWEHLFPYACKEGDSPCGFAIHRALNRAITVPSDGDKN